MGSGLDKSKNLINFEIAGIDKRFYPAKAQIVNNKVIVKNEQVNAYFC